MEVQLETDAAIAHPDGLSERQVANQENSRKQAIDVPARPKIVVVGCSGHARVVVDILEEENRCRIVGLLDTYKPAGTEVLGYQVLGSDEDLAALVAAGVCNCAIVAIGDNWVRSRIVKHIKELAPNIKFVSAIHPAARIASNVSIGIGSVVMAGAVINPCSSIGEFCILNTGCSLDHDCIMGDFSSLAPRAVTGGSVTIGRYTAIAIGATISHEINVGEHTVVGAGATVLKDVPSGVVAYGTPARVIRERSPDEPYLGARTSKPSAPEPEKAPAIIRSLQSVTLVPPTSNDWQSYLERTPHDFFHTAQYHLAETLAGGEAWLAVYGKPEKFVAWPCVLRSIDRVEKGSAGNLRDVTSVYGYAGPLTHGCDQDEAFLSSAWQAQVEAWRSQSVVSVFTRFHPLLANHGKLHYHGNEGQVLARGGPCAHGKTVAINLSLSQAEIWDAYKRQLRQALRRLSNFEMVTTPDPEWEYLDDFVRLYYSTMKRNTAAPLYFFPGRYFRKLKDALGSHGSLLITRHNGEVVGGALLIEFGGIVNVHLLAVDDRFSSLSVSKLVIHQAQAWAQERGNQFLHLGGGRGNRDDDPLFRFKALFSNHFFPFFTGRWILDEEAYAFLADQRRKESARLKSRHIQETHFPLYRAPYIEFVEAGKCHEAVANDSAE